MHAKSRLHNHQCAEVLQRLMGSEMELVDLKTAIEEEKRNVSKIKPSIGSKNGRQEKKSNWMGGMLRCNSKNLLGQGEKTQLAPRSVGQHIGCLEEKDLNFKALLLENMVKKLRLHLSMVVLQQNWEWWHNLKTLLELISEKSRLSLCRAILGVFIDLLRSKKERMQVAKQHFHKRYLYSIGSIGRNRVSLLSGSESLASKPDSSGC